MASSSSQPSLEKISSDLQDGMLINFGICGIFGFVINLIILTVLWRKFKKGKTHTDVKICSIVCFIDVLVSLGLIFRAIFVKYPYNILKYNANWCKFETVMVTVLMNCSGYVLGVMSIERFLLVCWNIQLPMVFWFILIILVIVTAQLFTIASVISDFQVLTITEVSCTVKVENLGYYCYFVSTTLFFISFIIVVLSYFSIMAVKAKQCLNQINLNIPKDTVYAELRSTLIKSCIYISLYILVFMTKFVTLAYSIIGGKKITLLMAVVSTILLSYSPLVNAIILLYMNQDIRVDFVNFIKSIKSKLFNNQ
jgi:hypothetical protein